MNKTPDQKLTKLYRNYIRKIKYTEHIFSKSEFLSIELEKLEHIYITNITEIHHHYNLVPQEKFINFINRYPIRRIYPSDTKNQ